MVVGRIHFLETVGLMSSSFIFLLFLLFLQAVGQGPLSAARAAVSSLPCSPSQLSSGEHPRAIPSHTSSPWLHFCGQLEKTLLWWHLMWLGWAHWVTSVSQDQLVRNLNHIYKIFLAHEHNHGSIPGAEIMGGISEFYLTQWPAVVFLCVDNPVQIYLSIYTHVLLSKVCLF